MTLRRRARTLADAQPPHHLLYDLFMVAAVAVLTVGVFALNLPITAAGALALGLELGRRGTDPERRYLEGFADGLTAADLVDDREGSRDPRVVPELREGAGVPDDGAADGGGRSRRRPHPAREPAGDDIIAAAGTSVPDRQPRPSLGPDGSPLSRGVGSVSFAPVPGFDAGAALGELGALPHRPEAGPEAHHPLGEGAG